MTILDAIVAFKRQEIEDRKKIVPIETLEKSEFYCRETFSLKKNLQDVNQTGIIAEFKRSSPSKGMINEWADVIEITTGYAKSGASGLSVLTDNRFFGGNNNDVTLARKTNKVPILRKEFIIDEYQILEAKSIGADVILLIAAILDKQQILQFSKLAKNLNLEILLEVHNEKELESVNPFIDMVGINNRDLRDFSVDLRLSAKLANLVPENFVKVSESGIHSAKDIQFLKGHGFRGFLIGEAFMKNEKPADEFKVFVENLGSNQ